MSTASARFAGCDQRDRCSAAIPWSGGGKVKQFGLKAMADELGVETVFLDKGLDLAELARDAIARGADCLGMAGGDGSQALVAAIAHEHDIPFVCISAGTRNHFAQDLGFDKEDPRNGMVAFRDGVERFVDYATVGDRLFVNNVSLGVYGTIVQQESYRNAKLETAMRMLPGLLSREAEPFDLQFTTPDGVEIEESLRRAGLEQPLCVDSLARVRAAEHHGFREIGGLRGERWERARGSRDRRAGVERTAAARSVLPRVHRREVRGAIPQRQGLRRHRRRGRRA